MKLLHWMKKENSGLATSTLELVKYEEKAGHQVEVRQPGEDNVLYGGVEDPDVPLKLLKLVNPPTPIMTSPD